MELIFVRHAKAEERRDNLDDRQRHLTEKGKAKFTQLMPQLLEKLSPSKDLPYIIWSSPANRAIETAEIVAQSLEHLIDDQYEFIYTGDFEAFTTALQEVDDKVTLILVGHEPTWSTWSAKLANRSIDYKKGGIASFKLTSKDPVQANFLWQIQP